MQRPILPRRKPERNSDAFETLTIALIGRMDAVTDRLDNVAQRMDHLATVIIEHQKPPEEQTKDKRKEITTVVALVVFALTMLTAIIVKGCAGA